MCIFLPTIFSTYHYSTVLEKQTSQGGEPVFRISLSSQGLTFLYASQFGVRSFDLPETIDAETWSFIAVQVNLRLSNKFCKSNSNQAFTIFKYAKLCIHLPGMYRIIDYSNSAQNILLFKQSFIVSIVYVKINGKINAQDVMACQSAA